MLEDVDIEDHPDFCDAFISSCEIDGIKATEEELEIINNDAEFVNNSVFNYLY